jgi:TetR/AcrR family transcriptional regulator, tetracycline repressor protein
MSAEDARPRRRGAARAARAPLSVEDFVAATLELVDTHGIEAVSMRRVAAHLGVSPMAAYRHFRDKEDLLVHALDAFAGRAELLPQQPLAWAEWVCAVARGMHDALAAHPGWIPLLGSLRLGKHAASLTRAFVERLVAEGFTPERALRAWFAVNQIVIGAVCMGGPLVPPVEDAPAPGASGPRGAGPVALEMAEELRRIGPVAQLDIGMDFIIEALTAALGRS